MNVTGELSMNALTENQFVRPFLKYAGGKSSILHEILPRTPQVFHNYHEPFVGGGAVYWALAKNGELKDKIARLSDTNLRLITLYQQLQENHKAIISILGNLTNDAMLYYQIRTLFNKGELEPATLAAYFIYLNKTCYNGMYRVNQQNHFNVPFGKYSNPNFCDESNIITCARILNSVKTEIECLPFQSVLNYAKKDDFVYFDSPYLPLSDTSNFTSYTKEGFTLADHNYLCSVAIELSYRKVKVMLSNSDHPHIHELYKDHFKITQVNCKRSVNSNGEKRGEISELIITNY
jgi:DNA adenine methylase